MDEKSSFYIDNKKTLQISASSQSMQNLNLILSHTFLCLKKTITAYKKKQTEVKKKYKQERINHIKEAHSSQIHNLNCYYYMNQK